MNVLNFMIGLHHALRVGTPESDYPKLATIDGSVEHLASLDAASHKETAR
jgi:hypothetical protein